jgi:DNA-binding NarL/FixJ family response regulator
MIRVIVADDHGVVRDGLGRLVEAADGLALAGLAADGEQAVALCAQHRPDVMLMDLDMPVMDGIEATRRITADMPGVSVIVLTAFSDRRRIQAAREAGAAGYLLKDASSTEVADAIRAAARGERPLDPRITLPPPDAHDPLAALSPREREVLALLVEGLPNKLIARRLEISEKTVKTHLTRVFREIGVTDRTQAALWAEREGFGPG